MAIEPASFTNFHDKIPCDRTWNQAGKRGWYAITVARDRTLIILAFYIPDEIHSGTGIGTLKAPIFRVAFRIR